MVRTVFGIGRKLFNDLDPLYKKLKGVRVRDTIRYHDATSAPNYRREADFHVWPERILASAGATLE